MAFTKELRTELVSLLGEDWVKDDPVTLYTYRCDGLTLYTAPPMGVVFPGNRNELVEVVKKLHSRKIPFVPRGAGTGLSGGAVPREQSVIIEMAISMITLCSRGTAPPESPVPAPLGTKGIFRE